MKKKFLLTISVLFSFIAVVSATGGEKTTCGKYVITLGGEAFDTWGEYAAYLDEINQVNCGESAKLVQWVHDKNIILH